MRDLSGAEIATSLNAAQWAPGCAGHMQPWRFVVAERGDSVHALLVSHLSRGNSGWVPRASVVFLAATELEDESGMPIEGKADAAGNLYALGQAAAHLALQAQAMGLWSHQFSGLDRDAVADALRVPRGVRIVAGIAVGHRGDVSSASEQEQLRERRREPLSSLAFHESWGRPWAADS
ncbi:nitroreductase family protein [Nocardioides bruguierae]|uniref:Nitroreductase family protein n=1 Tax=Nocardioides bruguierae TaxID=2945102 RepID=A0A9X2DBQ4_9ACTN|nr:nitroreductase family protein [Nocardioides bruguierae]MCM0622745.1 nitroreductase family protein [Nocardioides bruguierae]